jgi:hypothetical protein
MARRRKKRRTTLYLGLVFGLLVAINIYVFFLGAGSLGAVSAAVHEEERPPTPPPPPPPKAVVRKVEGKLREGEAMGAALVREGVVGADRDGVLRALAPVLDFRKELQRGQRYELQLAGDGALVAFVLRTAKATIVVERTTSGKLAVRKEP